jgi:hypothetical protein
MRELRYTLVSDGSSDRALLPILSWLLMEHRVLCPIQAEWADLRRLRYPPRTLASRIECSLDLYPCDILFIHRDAEIRADRRSYQQRKDEIIGALANINLVQIPPICVVPVRMMEAWLLINEAALRRAAGNPNGATALNIPNIAHLEEIPDPKEVLYTLLRVASELRGRRLKRFEENRSAGLVAEYIDDFAQLRRLSAFRALEADIEETITINQWADAS